MNAAIPPSVSKCSICEHRAVCAVGPTIATAHLIGCRAFRPASQQRSGAGQTSFSGPKRSVAVEKLSRAIEQTADSVLITNSQGIIEYVNPAFEGMTGLTRESVIGYTPRILRSGIHSPAFYEHLWSTILMGGTFRSVMTNRRQDGTFYDEDQTITPITNADGVITHFVSTGRDITQRKRSEEALRRLNQQLETEAARIGGILHDEAGQFLTSAHLKLAEVSALCGPELREKLTSVRGDLDSIEKRLREISHEIHPQIVEELGLGRAAEYFAEGFRRRSGIALSFESRLARSSSLQVQTILYRLIQEGLTNVSRHTKATSVAVCLDDDERTLSCSITDNGGGFDPAALSNGAPGLGLRLMQARVEAVGGSLAIISAPGRGTELVAHVPVED